MCGCVCVFDGIKKNSFRPSAYIDSSFSETHPKEPRLLLGIARIQDMLNNTEAAALHYKRVLTLDASHVESIACLAANHFYNDQVLSPPPVCLSVDQNALPSVTPRSFREFDLFLHVA